MVKSCNKIKRMIFSLAGVRFRCATFTNALLSSAILLTLFPANLQADEIKDEGLQLEIYERGRRFILLPLENKTGDAELDYLRVGIPRMLRSGIAASPYIREVSPGRLYYLNPFPGDVNHIPAEVYDKPGHTRLSLSVEVFEPEDHEVEAAPVMIPGMPGAGKKIKETRKSYAVMIKEGESSYSHLLRLRRTAGEFNADYILGGEYVRKDKSGNDIEIHLILFNAMKDRARDYNHKSELDSLYRNMNTVSDRIRGDITGDELLMVRVRTDAPNAMVYLDDNYLGRSPVEKAVLPGIYTLSVQQTGYDSVERTVAIGRGRKNEFVIHNRKLEFDASLRVDSEPEGADVYLNANHLGKTPLVADKLEPGTHRIRLSMDGHVDRFVGVILENGKQKSAFLTLKEGDSISAYSSQKYAFMDWTYDELALNTALTSLTFYGSYWYHRGRADTILESVRPLVYTTAIWDIYDNPDFGLYQLYLMDQNWKEAQVYRERANLSANLTFGSLFLASYFLIRGVVLDDQNVGEVEITQTPVRTMPLLGVLPDNRNGKNDSRYIFGLQLQF